MPLVLEEYIREALFGAVMLNMSKKDVLDTLYPLLLRHGKTECIRSKVPIDCVIGSSPTVDGAEFVVESVGDWLRKVGIKPIESHPGRSPRDGTIVMPCLAGHGRTAKLSASTEPSGEKL